MGATNTTANYSLSQFIGTDKPAWLQDYNGDMLKIDTGINAAKVAADGAQNSASAAQNDATTANNAITNTINPAISSLNTTVGNQGGAINTINSLIGNGTPTTTDQTIIGAINEINGVVNDSAIDQRAGKSLSFQFGRVVGLAETSNSFIVNVPLPTYISDTSYTANLTNFTINNIPTANISSATVSVKRNAEIIITATLTGGATADKAYQCGGNLEIIFA